MEKSYTFEEVHKAALDYFKQDEMAAMAWIKKYCLKNDDDTYAELTPDDMHKRLAKKFSEVEEKYEYTTNDKLKLKLSEYGYNRKKLEEDDIYQLLKDFKYVVPGGSVLSGLGSKLPVSLSNCFVITSPKDSISSIFKVCNEMAQLEKRRGGVGFDISLLRPNGAKVHNSAETSTGAASFMDLFSAVNSTIAQCGRRGALMLSISIKHPDSLEFILKKQDLSKVTGANVSVQITDEFMQKVENNEDFFQTFPVDGQFDEFDKNSPYDELVECKQKNGKIGYYKRVSAKELWDKLIHCAWNTAEPGILFQTRHHNFSPDGVYPQFKMVSTNPCLVGDTMIKTSNGDMKIKDIVDAVKNGENIDVLTFNESTKELEYKKVEDGQLTKENANVIQLETEEGDFIKLTPDHKVYTENRGWVQASKLTENDVVVSVSNKTSKIKAKNDSANEDVYDLKVQDNHNFFFFFILVHNCGEIGMQEDSCRLIHLNISSFVDNPFTDNAKFNDEKFYRFTYEATRLGDDLVDLEYEALQRIIDKINEDDDKDESELNLYHRLMDNTLNGRRCGVGFFGLADAIAMMGMKYDSKNGIEMIDHIMRIMFVANMDSEIDMAITRGTFRSYDKKLEEKGNDWYNNLKEKMPLLYRKMMMYGRRNVSFSTVAPTGTLALLAHRTGGIEPVFMPIYNRRVKCMKPDDRVDFIDPNGEKYTEYITVHPTLKEWALAKYGEEIENYSSEKWNEIYKKSPWNGSAAQDIDWVKRTEIQGIVQNYISHSISSCVVPETLIQMENGGYMYIDELSDFSLINENEFKNNDSLETLVKTHDGSFNRIKSFYNNGEKDVLELKLVNGLSVQCTSNERFMVYDDDKSDFVWKHLYEIKEGDIIKI